jgi:hypothetical protein
VLILKKQEEKLIKRKQKKLTRSGKQKGKG